MTDTRTTILDAAERRFAAEGIHGVSLRSILTDSGINPALAHYHFGSKVNLIKEILLRRFAPLTEERLRLLDELEARPGDPGYTLHDVLRAFLAPALRLIEEAPDFARFLGQMGHTRDEELQSFHAEHFTPSLHRFSTALKRVLPAGITGTQRVARGFFMLGLIGWTLANCDLMEALARGRYRVPRGEELLAELVAFTAAGFTAELPRDQEGSCHG